MTEMTTAELIEEAKEQLDKLGGSEWIMVGVVDGLCDRLERSEAALEAANAELETVRGAPSRMFDQILDTIGEARRFQEGGRLLPDSLAKAIYMLIIDQRPLTEAEIATAQALFAAAGSTA